MPINEISNELEVQNFEVENLEVENFQPIAKHLSNNYGANLNCHEYRAYGMSKLYPIV